MLKRIKMIAISLVALTGVLGLALPMTASAANAWYCGPGAYNTAYRAVYQYPTGSYWQSQIAAYPDYYAANNAYYLANFGC